MAKEKKQKLPQPTKTIKTPEEKKEVLEQITETATETTEKPKRDRVRLIKKIVFFAIVIGALIYLFWGIPLPTSLGLKEPVSTKIYDRNEKLIYEVFTAKKRSPIKLSDLPTYMKNATISIEDKDFYSHSAFSPTGIIRAVYNTVFKRNIQGGSTLTQQLVRTAFLNQDRTITRKIREFLLSMVVEAIYSKDQILEA